GGGPMEPGRTGDPAHGPITRHSRSSRAFFSSSLVIVERPSTSCRLASSYSWSLVRPWAPEWERSPPRSDGDLSFVATLLASSDSPCCARALLTVRAAISSAVSSLSPRPSALSLTCWYWRSRFLFQASGMT